MGWVMRFAVAAAAVGARASSGAVASDTPAPSSVTIAGSLQSELGCPGDWQPECAATHLTFDATDEVWQATFAIPAGDWEYRAPLNDRWDENYGVHGLEATQIEYKYTLGDWEHVEKDGSCGEIDNRQLTLTYGTTGTQNVNDTVPNFRNVAPRGN